MSSDTSPIEDYWKTIINVPAFSRLSDQDVQKIIDVCEVNQVEQGKTLVREGDSADCFYIVIRGRFNVFIGDKLIAQIVSGEPIGEIAFFAETKRSATVIAARDSEVITLSQRAYEKLFRELPELNRNIISALAERVAKTTKSSKSIRPKTGGVISVVAGGGNAIPSLFIDQLKSAVSELDDWFFVELQTIPPEIKENVYQLSSWLSDLERRYTGIIIAVQDDESNTELAQHLASNSDVLFIACDAKAESELNEFEKEIFAETESHAKQLVIYRDNDDQPITDTAKLLTNRDVQLHHHVVVDNPEDYQRVVRFMTGQALGIVMCGGGVLGTAHVGLIKSLEEHGYKMDMAGGTSVGAAMSGAYAALASPDHIIEQCDDIFIRSKAMKKITLPLYSVIDHQPFDAQMKKHYGPYKIEDLPLNFFAVTTNLSNNDIKIVRRGELWEAVRSSAAIPAVLPPFIDDDGDVLIDGALMDNTPVDIMRDLKAGPNIIFSIKNNEEWKPKANYQNLPGRLDVLRRLLPFGGKRKSKFPGIFNILSRTMVVNSRRLLKNIEKEQDIFIEYRPPKGTGFLDWRKGHDLFEGAYNVMNQAFAEVDRNNPGLITNPMSRLRAAATLVNKNK